ncbi:uncharacterized protein BX663DRAFT_553843 [Cokeromyces recurvatus]|uniref:uncharacterized protein n=1 Tax=Cokeromyces recurvatus TaxID=90255 RepID=UPI00221F9887|nr:uncharacterized protein BX663DRAFT_553843 [Cokeromyces recurvatus]KAI7900535.1 hypothetical protein BX663DRAFT_553843 [Cokeromyces recurvatus]
MSTVVDKMETDIQALQLDELSRNQVSAPTSSTAEPTVKLPVARKRFQATRKRRFYTEEVVETVLKLYYVDRFPATKIVRGLDIPVSTVRLLNMAAIPADQRDSVIPLLKSGVSTREVAKRVGISLGGVSKIGRQNCFNRDKNKGGRHSILTAADKRHCVHLVTKGRLENAVEVQKQLKMDYTLGEKTGA